MLNGTTDVAPSSLPALNLAQRDHAEPPAWPFEEEPAAQGLLAPDRTTFIILAFEGPDAYARAGGLGVRVAALSEALADLGYTVHLLFVGDPRLPGQETRRVGRLALHRWCQWISAYHPVEVYADEEGKWRDFTESAPSFVVDQLAGPDYRRVLPNSAAILARWMRLRNRCTA